jgi:Fe-S cluster biogenesis protein NfuA
MVISHLNHYFEKSSEPILKDEKKLNMDTPSNDETINKIIEVLDSKVRPAVAKDGGDIKFKSFEDGIVKVELQGSCSGCPSSLMTLKQGVQNLLKHYVKEVNSVEAI